MSKDGGNYLAYQPDSFNPIAFSLLTYRRPGTENTLLLFPSPPDVGLNTLEELVAATGASEPRESEIGRAFSLLAAQSARVFINDTEASRGIAVPFVEAAYPSAAIFNSGTGGWTSAKVQAALATVDRSNVFRALEDIPGQEAAGIVVESPNALASAARVVEGVTERAVLASSISPACMAITEAKVSEILESPSEVFEAAAVTTPNRQFVLRPYSGLNAGQREILIDGIFADGRVLFASFSEKRRVDPDPPYMDRRITTLADMHNVPVSLFTDVIVRVFDRIGVRNTVFHAEFAMTTAGPLMTDLLARPGGGFIPEMVRARFGVDLRAAHVYAAFEMVSELRRIAGLGLDSGLHVAIAACYIDEGNRTKYAAGAALTERLSRSEDVIAYNIETVATNVAIGLPDVRACLAVRGETPDSALAELDSIATEFGFS
ncbi:hypothetical protein [Synechococcus sp. EJ6-Ellesmere]|uniref:hypothetical protein n=1 Tax=Synechococcus sp. EJ6-Ellesmere TaxID=2823734 RepID=UPI0020CD22DD|nr:hypothetical protein [Synechococcus sp. EJ6-Ellesmere]MCP9823848.1 hypothetical protein [Synechococcus sp. EJ6-Ellesmere]